MGVKCPVCGVDNDKLGAIKIGTRYYCEKCAIIKNKESKDYKDLCSYIIKITGNGELSGFALKQISNFKVKGYTYSGIQYTLKYFIEIKQNSLKGNGIGIVDYMYDEAKKYWMDKHKKKEELCEVDVNKVNNESIVYINKNKKNTFVKGMINMEDL